MNSKISIICIGDELLKGKITNSHLAYMGSELLKYGIIPELQLTVKDNSDDIKSSLFYCKVKSNILILTGGLGPTTDDITVQTVADFFNLKLVQSEQTLHDLKNFLKFRGCNTISESNLKQTFVPESSTVISNPNGTAPGIKLTIDETTVFLLPGPPPELKPMFTNYVMPFILSMNKSTNYFESIYAVNTPESSFQEIVSELLGNSYYKFNIAFRATPGICELMISGPDKQQVQLAIGKIKNYYQKAVLSSNFIHPAEEIAYYFSKNNITLSTAESCTGGMIAAKITDIPGASLFFKGGYIVYSNELKKELLGISNETLNKYGAVSAETAEEMVIGLCKNSKTNSGIVTTGIAGPDGGTAKKPVGLVYVAVKFFDKLIVKKHLLRGNREMIRLRTVILALDELRKLAIK